MPHTRGKGIKGFGSEYYHQIHQESLSSSTKKEKSGREEEESKLDCSSPSNSETKIYKHGGAQERQTKLCKLGDKSKSEPNKDIYHICVACKP